MLYSIHLLRFFAASILVIAQVFNVIGVPKTVLVGDVGVDLFFIISGVAIGLSAKPGMSPIGFMVRRIIRVVPPYWLATFATIALSYLWTKPVTPSFSDLWHSLLFIPAPSGFPILFPGWALNFGMLFYCTFGALLWLCPKDAKPVCMIVMVSLATLAYALERPDLMRCVEFAMGLAIARPPSSNRPIGALCIAAGLLALFMNRHGGAASGPFFWGIPCFLLVIGVTQFDDLPFLRGRTSAILGDASYSIVLFHVPIMVTLQQAVIPLWMPAYYLWPTVILMAAFAIIGGIVIDLAIIGPMTAGLRRAWRQSGERRLVLQPGSDLVAGS